MLYFLNCCCRYKFVKICKFKFQSDVVPVGHIPRTISVFCRGENTRLVLPGDHVAITGIFLPLLRQGFSQIAHGLVSEHFIDAQVRAPREDTR